MGGPPDGLQRRRRLRPGEDSGDEGASEAMPRSASLSQGQFDLHFAENCGTCECSQCVARNAPPSQPPPNVFLQFRRSRLSRGREAAAALRVACEESSARWRTATRRCFSEAAVHRLCCNLCEQLEKSRHMIASEVQRHLQVRAHAAALVSVLPSQAMELLEGLRRDGMRVAKTHITDFRGAFIPAAELLLSETSGGLEEDAERTSRGGGASAGTAAAGSPSLRGGSAGSFEARRWRLFVAHRGFRALMRLAVETARLPAAWFPVPAEAALNAADAELLQLLQVTVSESFLFLREAVIAVQSLAEVCCRDAALVGCLLDCISSPFVFDAAELLLEELLAAADAPLALASCSPCWLRSKSDSSPQLRRLQRSLEPAPRPWRQLPATAPSAAAALTEAFSLRWLNLGTAATPCGIAGSSSREAFQGIDFGGDSSNATASRPSSWSEPLKHGAAGGWAAPLGPPFLQGRISQLPLRQVAVLARLLTLTVLDGDDRNSCAYSLSLLSGRASRSAIEEKGEDAAAAEGQLEGGGQSSSSSRFRKREVCWSRATRRPLGKAPPASGVSAMIARLLEEGPLCSSSQDSQDSEDSERGEECAVDGPKAEVETNGGCWLELGGRPARAASEMLLSRLHLTAESASAQEMRRRSVGSGFCCSEAESAAGRNPLFHTGSCEACLASNRRLLLESAPSLVERFVELLKLQSLPLPHVVSGVACFMSSSAGGDSQTETTSHQLIRLFRRRGVFDHVLQTQTRTSSRRRPQTRASPSGLFGDNSQGSSQRPSELPTAGQAGAAGPTALDNNEEAQRTSQSRSASARLTRQPNDGAASSEPVLTLEFTGGALENFSINVQLLPADATPSSGGAQVRGGASAEEASSSSSSSGELARRVMQAIRASEQREAEEGSLSVEAPRPSPRGREVLPVEEVGNLLSLLLRHTAGAGAVSAASLPGGDGFEETGLGSSSEASVNSTRTGGGRAGEGAGPAAAPEEMQTMSRLFESSQGVYMQQRRKVKLRLRAEKRRLRAAKEASEDFDFREAAEAVSVGGRAQSVCEVLSLQRARQTFFARALASLPPSARASLLRRGGLALSVSAPLPLQQRPRPLRSSLATISTQAAAEASDGGAGSFLGRLARRLYSLAYSAGGASSRLPNAAVLPDGEAEPDGEASSSSSSRLLSTTSLESRLRGAPFAAAPCQRVSRESQADAAMRRASSSSSSFSHSSSFSSSSSSSSSSSNVAAVGFPSNREVRGASLGPDGGSLFRVAGIFDEEKGPRRIRRLEARARRRRWLRSQGLLDELPADAFLREVLLDPSLRNRQREIRAEALRRQRRRPAERWRFLESSSSDSSSATVSSESEWEERVALRNLRDAQRSARRRAHQEAFQPPSKNSPEERLSAVQPPVLGEGFLAVVRRLQQTVLNSEAQTRGRRSRLEGDGVSEEASLPRAESSSESRQAVASASSPGSDWPQSARTRGGCRRLSSQEEGAAEEASFVSSSVPPAVPPPPPLPRPSRGSSLGLGTDEEAETAEGQTADRLTTRLSSLRAMVAAALRSLRFAVTRGGGGEAEELLLQVVLQNVMPPEQLYAVKVAAVIQHTPELYFLLCALLGGSTRAAVQKRLLDLGLVNVLSQLLAAQLWLEPRAAENGAAPRRTRDLRRRQQRADGAAEASSRAAVQTFEREDSSLALGRGGSGQHASDLRFGERERRAFSPPNSSGAESSSSSSSSLLSEDSLSELSSDSAEERLIPGDEEEEAPFSEQQRRQRRLSDGTTAEAAVRSCCEMSLCSLTLELLRLTHDFLDFESGAVAAATRAFLTTPHERNKLLNSARETRCCVERPPVVKVVRRRVLAMHRHPLLQSDGLAQQPPVPGSQPNLAALQGGDFAEASNAGLFFGGAGASGVAAAAAAGGVRGGGVLLTVGPHGSSERHRRTAVRYLFKGTAGLLSRLIAVYAPQPLGALYKFWLAAALEASVRGAAPLLKLHAAKAGLVKALLCDVQKIVALRRERAEAEREQRLREAGAEGRGFCRKCHGRSHAAQALHRGVLQCCGDLLGEVVKFNPAVWEILEAELRASPAALEAVEHVLLNCLVDSNVLLRSLVLTAEFSLQVFRLHQLVDAHVPLLCLPDGAEGAAPPAASFTDPKMIAAAAAAAAAQCPYTPTQASLALPLWLQVHFYERTARSQATLHVTEREKEEGAEAVSTQRRSCCLTRGFAHVSSECCNDRGCFASPSGLTVPFVEGVSLRFLLKRKAAEQERERRRAESLSDNARDAAAAGEGGRRALPSSSGEDLPLLLHAVHAQPLPTSPAEEAQFNYWEAAPLGRGLRPDPSQGVVWSVALAALRRQPRVFSGKLAVRLERLLQAPDHHLLHLQQLAEEEATAAARRALEADEAAAASSEARAAASAAETKSAGDDELRILRLLHARQRRAIVEQRREESELLQKRAEGGGLLLFFLRRREAELIAKHMCVVAFEEVMADSVCVVNSCLVLLLLALVDGRLPSTLAAVKRLLRDAEEAAARGCRCAGESGGAVCCGGDLCNSSSLTAMVGSLMKKAEKEKPPANLLGRRWGKKAKAEDEAAWKSLGVGVRNFWRLLHFWRVQYLRRTRDARGLEFACQIPLVHLHELVEILCGASDEPTSLSFPHHLHFPPQNLQQKQTGS